MCFDSVSKNWIVDAGAYAVLEHVVLFDAVEVGGKADAARRRAVQRSTFCASAQQAVFVVVALVVLVKRVALLVAIDVSCEMITPQTSYSRVTLGYDPIGK